MAKRGRPAIPTTCTVCQAQFPRKHDWYVHRITVHPRKRGRPAGVKNQPKVFADPDMLPA